MNWTKEQSYAINMPVSDIIVSAAAGSGKTAVMAERILKRLTEENCVDIDKILVVTYTQAAASEIRERIMKKIVEKMDEDGDGKRLSEQLLKLPYAHISTIHGFCLDLIKKYFYLLDVDPGVKIADETMVSDLKKQCIDNVFTNHYTQNDKVFLDLISEYTDRYDTTVSDAVIKLYDFSRTMPEPYEWINGLPGQYSSENTVATEYISKCASMAGRVAIDEYMQAIKLCDGKEDCIVLRNFLEKELHDVTYAIEKKNYKEMYEALSTLEFANWRLAKGDSVVREECKVHRENAKNIIKKNLMEKYLVYAPCEIEKDNAHVFGYIEKLAELTLEFSDELWNAKKENNIIDFSDFEHLTLKLLKNPDNTPTDVAYAVSESFEEIYVDEFQDCNNIQNTIFNYISGAIRNKPNVFCVGDMKQSIYSFRDSNPLIFRDKTEKYELYDGVECKGANKILLNSNFRSRKTILEFVNSLFSQIMSRECGDVTYDKEERLNYGDGYIHVNENTLSVDIDLIDSSDSFDDNTSTDVCNDNDTSVSDEEISDIEAEATHVASKIKKMISDGYKLYDSKAKCERTAQYKDFAILMRGIKTSAPIFEKALSDMGIPAYCDSGTPYFDAPEIKFLISFLKMIDNPDDDISLVAVMKNPFFGFDENKLLEIRLSNRKLSYYECIKEYCKNHKGNLCDRLKAFLDTIGSYYEKSRYMDANEFLRYLIDDVGYYAYLSTFYDSKLKKANVRFLLHKAKEFETEGFKGIYNFVNYVENYLGTNSKESAKILSENDNVVRIMTIHKSKGLEFPIVFLSCTGKKFNKQDVNSKFVFHKEYGIGVDSVYKDISARFKTANKIASRLKMSYELISEELRVLYVALTRASEKLVITASVSNGPRFLSECESSVANEPLQINPYKIYSCNNFIQMILMGVSRCEGYPERRNDKLLVSGDFTVNMNLINKSNVKCSAESEDKPFWKDLYDGPTENYEKLKMRLSYEYPHSDSSLYPSNMTVTEVKRLYSESEDFYTPFDDVSLESPKYFGKKQKVFGKKLGTLVHLVMEKLEFDKISDLNSVENQIKRLADSNLITEEEKSVIVPEKIYKFFLSDIGKETQRHHHSLKKEFSFKYLENAGKIFGTDFDDRIVVQGTIDAFFEDENGEIVLIDYKTDSVADSNCDSIVQKYKTQLDYYATALEKIYNKKVRSKILYLFDIDKSITL